MKKFAKNESGISPVGGIILIIAITIVLVAIILLFVSGLGNPETNAEAVKEKNPNIEYVGNGILRVSGNNSAELAVNLKEFNWMNSCRMDEDQPFPIATENNKSYILLAINAACASNFK